MWFNNLVIYKFNSTFSKDITEINTALYNNRLLPCPPHARQTQGFINPCNDSPDKVYSQNGCHLIVAAKETRLLPASIIQTVLEEKLNVFELMHNRAMPRAESMKLKEEIEFDLLPKAFVVQKKDWLYIDTNNQWIVINNANLNKASEIIVLLIKTLGGLDVIPWTMDVNLRATFDCWLSDPSSLPPGLTLGKNCVLINEGEDKSQYTCRDIEQNSKEIFTLLEQGYAVSSLEVIWQERLQFTLADNFLIKKLKCLDYLTNQLKDNSKLDTSSETFAANFSLLINEISMLLKFLTKVSSPKKQEVSMAFA